MQEKDWNLYFRNVKADFREMKKYYPFSYLTIPPTTNPQIAIIRVIAANRDLIEMAKADEDDFLGEYTREIYVEVVYDYRTEGCKVYGARWIDTKKLLEKDKHFYYDKEAFKKYGNELCVGIPESFSLMNNVILENVRTAENMLIAYERVMIGKSKELNLIAYAHGEDGKKQFRRNTKRYDPRRCDNEQKKSNS